ncbi:hypothetical protein ASE26_09730 [Duganella sp. Root198D2]|nr:hypothetical protein ASE26_09730 [Duganella sp. Root198D2]
MDADAPGAILPWQRNDPCIKPRKGQPWHQRTTEPGANHAHYRAQAAVFTSHLRQRESSRRERAVKHAAIGAPLRRHQEAFARNMLRPDAG